MGIMRPPNQPNQVLFVSVRVEEQEQIGIDLSVSEDIDVDIQDVIVEYISAEGFDFYNGKYDVVPSLEEQVLKTQNKILRDNVTVKEIPTYEVSNEFGTTMIIGG